MIFNNLVTRVLTVVSAGAALVGCAGTRDFLNSSTHYDALAAEPQTEEVVSPNSQATPAAQPATPPSGLSQWESYRWMREHTPSSKPASAESPVPERAQAKTWQQFQDAREAQRVASIQQSLPDSSAAPVSNSFDAYLAARARENDSRRTEAEEAVRPEHRAESRASAASNAITAESSDSLESLLQGISYLNQEGEEQFMNLYDRLVADGRMIGDTYSRTLEENQDDGSVIYDDVFSANFDELGQGSASCRLRKSVRYTLDAAGNKTVLSEEMSYTPWGLRTVSLQNIRLEFRHYLDERVIRSDQILTLVPGESKRRVTSLHIAKQFVSRVLREEKFFEHGDRDANGEDDYFDMVLMHYDERGTFVSGKHCLDENLDGTYEVDEELKIK